MREGFSGCQEAPGGVRKCWGMTARDPEGALSLKAFRGRATLLSCPRGILWLAGVGTPGLHRNRGNPQPE